MSPSATSVKIHEANRITFKKQGLLPDEYDDQIVSREDKERAKEIVANMVEQLKEHTKYLGPKESGVKIFFEEALSNAMPDSDVFQMTVSDRLAPRFVHKVTGAFYPISTFEDLKEAFGLMQTAGSNIRPYLVAMYNDVIYPLYSRIDEPRSEYKDGNLIAKEDFKGLRVKEIIDGAKVFLNLKVSSKEIHHKYLIPMAELGLINWAKSVLNGREKIYYPADPDSQKVNTLFPDGDLRLTVTDQSFYPDKQKLEQSYGFRSKRLSRQGVEKNISEIYKLEDPEGNEITISELVERYLSKPELCFKHGWNELEPADNFREGVRTTILTKNHNNVLPSGEANENPDLQDLDLDLTRTKPPPRPFEYQNQASNNTEEDRT